MQQLSEEHPELLESKNELIDEKAIDEKDEETGPLPDLKDFPKGMAPKDTWIVENVVKK